MRTAPRPRLAFTAPPSRMSAEQHRRRLEGSPLYQRREMAAKLTHRDAQFAAIWYLDSRRVERWPEGRQ